MTYLEALYGSQYYELKSKGRNSDAGRLNGNLFLSAFIIICIFLAISILFIMSESLSGQITQILHKLFGYSSGKIIGRLLAIPMIVIIYLIISKTVGSVSNYNRFAQSFMAYPDSEKQKANAKVLKPFLIALGLLFILMITQLI